MRKLFKIIKDKPQKFSIVLSIIVVSSLLFYWYELRPASIRVRCAPRIAGGIGSVVYKCGDWECEDMKRLSYEYCIHGYGLK